MSDTASSLSYAGGYNLTGNGWCGSVIAVPSVPHLQRRTALRREGWVTTRLLYLLAGSRNSPPLAIFFTFFAELSSFSHIATLFYCCHKIHLVGWFGKQTPPQNMEYQMPQSGGGRKGRRGECFLAALLYKFMGAACKVGHRTSYTIKIALIPYGLRVPCPRLKTVTAPFNILS